MKHAIIDIEQTWMTIAKDRESLVMKLPVIGMNQVSPFRRGKALMPRSQLRRPQAQQFETVFYTGRLALEGVPFPNANFSRYDGKFAGDVYFLYPPGGMLRFGQPGHLGVKKRFKGNAYQSWLRDMLPQRMANKAEGPDFSI
ncbi:hypothetical protein ASG50_24925 [Rhizobium sp. Leaf386]|nr:hypothetical protein ASG50_24925 [Rhizobium sp. Leaf386]